MRTKNKYVPGFGKVRSRERRVRLLTTLNELHKQEKRCLYCKEVLDFTKPIVVDHYIPAAANGINHIDNYRLACDFCDKTKGTIFGPQFIELLDKSYSLVPKWSRGWDIKLIGSMRKYNLAIINSLQSSKISKSRSINSTEPRNIRANAA